MAVPARIPPRPGKAAVARRSGRRWRKRFVEALAAGSDMAHAAETAGVTLARARETRRVDPDFAQAWQEALSDGYLHLEMEVLRRLREGDFTTRDGLKFDFASAIRLLGAQRDASGRGQNQVRDVSAAEVRASIDRKIEEIRRRVARQKAAEESAT
jgi:broad specificity phosphatase PhoE